MFPGETVFTGAPNPGTKPEVMQTGAGFYVGFKDEHGFPYTRETEYFQCEDIAEDALTQINTALSNGGNPSWLPFVRQ